MDNQYTDLLSRSNDPTSNVIQLPGDASDYTFQLEAHYNSGSVDVSTISGSFYGFDVKFDDVIGTNVLSWTSLEDPNTAIEIGRGDIQWYSSDQTSELANGKLVAIWSAYNGSGVYASILDPLTADFTTIDLTDSLGLVSGGGNDGLEAHHISIS